MWHSSRTKNLSKNLTRALEPLHVRMKMFGCSFALSCLGYPRTRMAWATRTRVPMVANARTRDRYFLLRNRVKIVDDDIPQHEKKADAYWKVRPLLTSVRKQCLQTPRTEYMSLDEQIIPFHGKSRMRRYVRGKPNPVGLKNFVVATPEGIPLDFFCMQGRDASHLVYNPRSWMLVAE